MISKTRSKSKKLWLNLHSTCHWSYCQLEMIFTIDASMGKSIHLYVMNRISTDSLATELKQPGPVTVVPKQWD